MRRNSLVITFCLSALIWAPNNAWAQNTGDAPAGEKKAGDDKPADAKGAAPDATPAPAAPAAAPAATAESAPVTPQNARVQLKALEQRVNELKERIFRSKARLNLLKETVLHGVIAGSRAIIRHKNEMGSSFRLVKVSYAVDGAQIYSSSNEDNLNDKREFDVFNGSIVPGNHTISTVMIFRGHGYGIFTYLKGYKFTVRASHTFTSAEGRQNIVTVRAFEKGNATTEMKYRPAIKFETSLYNVRAKGASK